MEQRDYLMRQIDQLGQALAKALAGLLGLEKPSQINEAIKTTNQFLKNELALDIEDLVAIPSADFINILIIEKKFTIESLRKLADILLFIADNSSNEKEQTTRNKLYSKCLIILEYLEKTETTCFFDQKMIIERIKNIL